MAHLKFSVARRARVAAFALCVAGTSVPVVVQAQAEGPPPLSSASVAGLARLRTDLDGGGNFSVGAGVARGSLGRVVTPTLSAQLNLSYGYEHWSFGVPGALGQTAPWDDINAPSVGMSLRYVYSEKTSFFVAPQVEWNYESGASASRGISYGAVIAATYEYSKSLTVGAGVGAFRQINRTQLFPILLVNWQINERLLLSNPFDAGPTGGPGLELSYKLDERWDAGIGVAFRDIRFRLRGDGPMPDGIGQDSGVPVFAHVTFTPAQAFTVDAYAGAIVNGQLKVLNSNGSTVSSSDYNAQPVLGIRATYAF